MGAEMLLPKIRTADIDKENKKLELIGERFREDLGSNAWIIEKGFGVTTPIGFADVLQEYYPNEFKIFEERIYELWETWCEQYDAECDPPMDKYHYLRAQA